jgi:hypothetical protein
MSTKDITNKFNPKHDGPLDVRLVGTTAVRPGVATAYEGMLRYNTTEKKFEAYTYNTATGANAWVDAGAAMGAGSTTDFTVVPTVDANDDAAADGGAWPGTTNWQTAPSDAVLGLGSMQRMITEIGAGQITAIVGAAPDTLDTLVEIASALNDDPNLGNLVNTSASNISANTAAIAGIKVGDDNHKLLTTNLFSKTNGGSDYVQNNNMPAALRNKTVNQLQTAYPRIEDLIAAMLDVSQAPDFNIGLASANQFSGPPAGGNYGTFQIGDKLTDVVVSFDINRGAFTGGGNASAEPPKRATLTDSGDLPSGAIVLEDNPGYSPDSSLRVFGPVVAGSLTYTAPAGSNATGNVPVASNFDYTIAPADIFNNRVITFGDLRGSTEEGPVVWGNYMNANSSAILAHADGTHADNIHADYDRPATAAELSANATFADPATVIDGYVTGTPKAATSHSKNGAYKFYAYAPTYIVRTVAAVTNPLSYDSGVATNLISAANTDKMTSSMKWYVGAESHSTPALTATGAQGAVKMLQQSVPAGESDYTDRRSMHVLLPLKTGKTINDLRVYQYDENSPNNPWTFMPGPDGIKPVDGVDTPNFTPNWAARIVPYPAPLVDGADFDAMDGTTKNADGTTAVPQLQYVEWHAVSNASGIGQFSHALGALQFKFEWA